MSWQVLPKLHWLLPPRSHAEFAERCTLEATITSARGVRGAGVREFSALAEMHTRIVAQRFWGAELAEVRGAAEDCSRGRDLRRSAEFLSIQSPKRTDFAVSIQPVAGPGADSVLRELRGPWRAWRPTAHPSANSA